MVLTAMNGVPWWFFDGFGGEFAGTRLRAIDPDGAIAAAIPARHVDRLRCALSHARRRSRGSCATHFGNQLIIGEPAGGKTARVEALAATAVRAGFDAPSRPASRRTSGTSCGAT